LVRPGISRVVARIRLGLGDEPVLQGTNHVRQGPEAYQNERKRKEKEKEKRDRSKHATRRRGSAAYGDTGGSGIAI
jgi:hypothetical protein